MSYFSYHLTISEAGPQRRQLQKLWIRQAVLARPATILKMKERALKQELADDLRDAIDNLEEGGAQCCRGWTRGSAFRLRYSFF